MNLREYLVILIKLIMRDVVLITIIMAITFATKITITITITFTFTITISITITLTLTVNIIILMQFKNCGWRPKDLCVLSQEIH